MSPEREQERRDFVVRSGWSGAEIVPRPGDASTRSYARVMLNGRKAMLMDQPQAAESPAAPTNATPEERRVLGYNAVARLASGDVGRFVAVAHYLRGLGLSAPEIYAADPAAGFALIEDLGDDLYADVLANGGDERALYAEAAGVLAKLHMHGAPGLLPPDKPLHAYDETAQLAEIDLMTEWFFPYAMNRTATADEVAEHRALWSAALAKVRGTPPVFVHRDYHAQNLLWLPDRAGVTRVGLIDFQDAVAGSPAQDLMHLIEDARRDVSPETSAATVRHYLDAMRETGKPIDEDAFRAEMATISGQRNARIAGIFARLYKRDGKPRYLSYLPRVWGHLNRDLEHPAMAALKSWYDKTIPRDRRGQIDGA